MKLFGYTILAATTVVSTFGQNIVQVAQSNGFNTLVAAATAADLATTLADTNDLTVFAPTDGAFIPLGPATTLSTPLAHLLNNNAYNKALLQDVLKTHVLTSVAQLSDVVDIITNGNGGPITAFSGQNLTFAQPANADPTVSTPVNTANITQTDLTASNGVIHVIDTVLLPNTFEAKTIAGVAIDSGFSVLVEALTAASLVDAFTNAGANVWTVFAPTDAAFVSALEALRMTKEELFADADLLGKILSAHVITSDCDAGCVTSGTNFTTFASEVIQVADLSLGATDIKTLNGIVHVVDQVIIPPSAALRVKTIAAAAQALLPNLFAAASAASLVEALNGETDLTVMAPVDAAFEDIGAGQSDKTSIWAFLTTGSEWSVDLLQQVLQTHVIGGKVLSNALPSDSTTPVNTLAEDIFFDINVSPATVSTPINSAEIVETDLLTNNGVVHLIDTVLVPSGLPLKSIADIAIDGGFNVLVEALQAANLVNVFAEAQANGAYTVFAPTDAAFVALLGELNLTKEELLQNTALLDTVLKAHVLPSPCNFDCVTAQTEVTTLSGEKIAVSSLQLGDRNINALNGIVHTLDAVIVPPSLSATEPEQAAEEEDSSFTTTAVAVGGALVGAVIVVGAISYACGGSKSEAQNEKSMQVQPQP